MSSALSVPQTDWFVQIFVSLDDMCHLIKRPSKPGRQANLTESELLTCIVFRFEFGIKDWFHTWKVLTTFHQDKFPLLPGYKNFLQGVHRCLPLLMSVLQGLLFEANRHSAPLGIVDSSPLPVCQNQWINRSRLFTGMAQRGKSSLGWFYGFKLHLALNHAGQLLGIQITTGNVNDRVPVPSLLKWFQGICLADAGYISRELSQKLSRKGILLLTSLRKNMRGLMTQWQHLLLNQRGYVECIFSVLKDKGMLYSTQARSLVGYMVNVLSCLFVYQVNAMNNNS